MQEELPFVACRCGCLSWGLGGLHCAQLKGSCRTLPKTERSQREIFCHWYEVSFLLIIYYLHIVYHLFISCFLIVIMLIRLRRIICWSAFVEVVNLIYLYKKTSASHMKVLWPLCIYLQQIWKRLRVGGSLNSYAVSGSIFASNIVWFVNVVFLIRVFSLNKKMFGLLP